LYKNIVMYQLCTCSITMEFLFVAAAGFTTTKKKK